MFSIFGYHVTKKKNLLKIFRRGLIPSVPADMSDDPKAVYLFIDEEALVDGLSNWLGDRFDEDEELAVLKVDILGLPTMEGADFEHVVPSLIPPSRICQILSEADIG